MARILLDSMNVKAVSRGKMPDPRNKPPHDGPLAKRLLIFNVLMMNFACAL
jgi:hypothetical protein